FAQPILHELRNILRVHQVGRELDDVSPARADRFKRRFDIREGLHALGVEIAVADQLAVAVDANLAGDEDEFRRLDAREMRVLTKRLAERVGVEELDVSHRQLRVLRYARPLGGKCYSTWTPLALIGASHFLTSLFTKSPSHCGPRSFGAATVAPSCASRSCTAGVAIAPAAASLSFFTTSAGAPFRRNKEPPRSARPASPASLGA